MLSFTTLRRPGSPLPQENPLPMFQTLPRTGKAQAGQSLLAEDLSLLGHETAPRFLPYRVQDRYVKAQHPRSYKAIVLENRHLKATFLPQFGARLYSLYHKGMQRQLLFSNPVIQPANLAVLDAWLAGGIEWNVGQFGHAVTTSSPVFCAALQDDAGNDFLRVYEYERMHDLFWQLDFHLPEDAETLGVYGRILNGRSTPTSAYYWCNIAAPENAKTRIFSATQEVLCLDMDSNRFERGRMPHLPTLPGKDASYPQNFTYSNEYFFQTHEEEPSPWEAAAYPDNWVFFERSSPLLRYRKMFCWGSHSGGRQWKDFLSRPGEGDYVELQAGLAKTQQHGLVLPPGGELEFYQCFGGFAADTAPFYSQDWHTARAAMEKAVDAQVPGGNANAELARLRRYRDVPATELLCTGSGFGALEAMRREASGEGPIPPGCSFPMSTLGEEQLPWLRLLQTGLLPDDPQDFPSAYMVQPQWQTLLSASLKREGGAHAASLLHCGIMLAEQGQDEEARKALLQSLRQRKNPLTLRCLAVLAQRAGQPGEARRCYEEALPLAHGEALTALGREYAALLAAEGENQAAWAWYTALPARQQQDEALRLQMLLPALEAGQLAWVEEQLSHPFLHIRENATLLSDAWIRLHQKLLAQPGETLTAEEAERRKPVPPHLDFRMN